MKEVAFVLQFKNFLLLQNNAKKDIDLLKTQYAITLNLSAPILTSNRALMAPRRGPSTRVPIILKHANTLKA